MAAVTSILKKELSDMRKELKKLEARVSAVEEGTALALKRSAGKTSEESKRAPEIEEIPNPAGSTDKVKVTGEQVKRMRKRLGISQVEMSLLLGVTSQSVSNWERRAGLLPLRTGTKRSWLRLKRMNKGEAISRLRKRL